MRVVSLLPSATELLLAITAANCGDGEGGANGKSSAVQLVGRSHECDFPEGASLASLPALTAARTKFESSANSSAQVDTQVRAALAAGQSLYTLDEALLQSLRPDLILTQDLCEVCSIDLQSVTRVAQSMHPQPAVLSFNPWTIEGAFDDALRLGKAIGLEREALQLVSGGGGWRERMDRAAELAAPFAAKPTTLFLEWTDPLFVGGHWTPQLIERAGGEHPLNPTVAEEGAGAAEGVAGQSQRKAGKSIVVPPAAIIAVRPEFIFVAPCGLNLEQTTRETDLLAARTREQGAHFKGWWDEMPAVRSGQAGRKLTGIGPTSGVSTPHGTPPTGPGVYCIDGNQMFNRPGPRLVDAFEFLAAVLNDRPDRVPPGFPYVRWRG